VSIGGGDGGNIRYARNSVSTSGSISSTQLQIASTFGRKQGITTINEYDDASLEKAVRRAESLAQLAPENPEYMPLLGPQTYREPAKTFIPETAAITTKLRADLAEKSLGVARDARVTAAGYLENSANFSALMNSHGLFAYNTGTNVNFSVTMRTNDGKGSGYASGGYNDINALDVMGIRRWRPGRRRRAAAPRRLNRGSIRSSWNRPQVSCCWKTSMDRWMHAGRMRAGIFLVCRVVRRDWEKSWWMSR